MLVVLFVVLFAVLWTAYHFVLPAAWRIAQRIFSAVTGNLLRRRPLAAWYERGATRLRPLHPYRPLAVIVVAGFVAAAITGAAFLQLAELVRQNSPGLQALDRRVWESARQLRSPAATTFFLAWTWLGTPLGLTAVIVTASVLLRLGRRPILPLFIMATMLAAWGMNHLLKVLFARARPDLSLAVYRSSGYAFPSGHAMMSVVAFGALAYAVMRVSGNRRWHSVALALASSIVAAVSLSRVYLGVHWLSDIVAGVAAGLVWLATTVGAYEAFRRLRAMRGERPAA